MHGISFFSLRHDDLMVAKVKAPKRRAKNSMHATGYGESH